MKHIQRVLPIQRLIRQRHMREQMQERRTMLLYPRVVCLPLYYQLRCAPSLYQPFSGSSNVPEGVIDLFVVAQLHVSRGGNSCNCSYSGCRSCSCGSSSGSSYWSNSSSGSGGSSNNKTKTKRHL